MLFEGDVLICSRILKLVDFDLYRYRYGLRGCSAGLLDGLIDVSYDSNSIDQLQFYDNFIYRGVTLFPNGLNWHGLGWGYLKKNGLAPTKGFLTFATVGPGFQGLPHCGRGGRQGKDQRQERGAGTSGNGGGRLGESRKYRE